METLWKEMNILVEAGYYTMEFTTDAGSCYNLELIFLR